MNWLLGTYQNTPDKSTYFLKNNFFNLLTGNSVLQKQVKDGISEKQIRESWNDDLEDYKKLRQKYLKYTDF